MTSEEYDKLSDEEKRIRIAKLCGWHSIRVVYDRMFGINPKLDKGRWELHVPNYLIDLNACRAFELQLMQENELLYIKYVQKLIDLMGGGHMTLAEKLVHASAEQKCKAFALVSNK